MGLPVRLFNGFTDLMNSIGTLWVFGMMFLICTDIFARNVFNFPLNGVPEVIAFSIAGTIYLQLANTLHSGRFTRAELLIDWLEVKRPVAGRVFNAIFNLFGAIVFLIMVRGFWAEFTDAWAENELGGVPGTITFIVWPFYLLLVVGGTATGLEFVFRLIRECAGMGKAFKSESDGWCPNEAGLRLAGRASRVRLRYLSADDRRTDECANRYPFDPLHAGSDLCRNADRDCAYRSRLLRYLDDEGQHHHRGTYAAAGGCGIHEELFLRGCAALCADGASGGGIRCRQGNLPGRALGASPCAGRAWYCDCCRQCGICGDYGLFNCFRRGVHPRGNAGNDGAGLYRAIFRWCCRRFVRAGHAYPA